MLAHQSVQGKEVIAEKKLHFAEDRERKEDQGIEAITPIKLEESARNINEENVNARSALKPQSRNNSFGRRLSMHGEVLRVHVDPTPQVVEASSSPLDENIHDEEKMEHVRCGVVANWLADIGSKNNKFHALLLDLATHILIRRPADPQQFIVDHFYSHELPLLQVVPNGRPFLEQQEEEYKMHHDTEKAEAYNERNTTVLSHTITKCDEDYDRTIRNRNDGGDDDDANIKESKHQNSNDMYHDQEDTLTTTNLSKEGISTQEQELFLEHNKEKKFEQTMENNKKIGKFTHTAPEKQIYQKREEGESGCVKNVEPCKTEMLSSSPLAINKLSCPVIEQLVSAIPAGPSKVAAYRLAEMLLNLKPNDPEHYLWTKLESRLFSDEAAVGYALASTIDDFPSISPDDRTQASLLREVAFDSAGYNVAANMISVLFTRKPENPITYLYYHFNGKVHTSEAQSIRSSSRRDATCDSASCTSRSCMDESDYATTNTPVTNTNNNNYEEADSSSVDSSNSDIDNYNEHYPKHGLAEVLPNEFVSGSSFNEQLLRKRENAKRSNRSKSFTSYTSSEAKCTNRENTKNESSHARRNTNVTLHRGGSFGSLAESLRHHNDNNNNNENNNDNSHHHKIEDIPDSCLCEHDFISSEQPQPEDLSELSNEELRERQVKQVQRKVSHAAHTTADLRRTSCTPLDDKDLYRHRKGSGLHYDAHATKRKHKNVHKASVELPIVTKYTKNDNINICENETHDMENNNIHNNDKNNNNTLFTCNEHHQKRAKRFKVSNNTNTSATTTTTTAAGSSNKSKHKHSKNSTMTNKWDAHAKGNASSLKSHVSFPSSSSEAFIANTNTSMSSCLSKNDDVDHVLDNNNNNNNQNNNVDTIANDDDNNSKVNCEKLNVEKVVQLPVSTLNSNTQNYNSQTNSAAPANSSRHVIINTDTSTTTSSASSSPSTEEEFISSPMKFKEPTFLNASQRMLVSSQKQYWHRIKPHTFKSRCSNNNNDNKPHLTNQENNIRTTSATINDDDWTILRNRYEVQIACLQHELDTLKATCAYRERMMLIEESEANKQECDKVHRMCTETEKHLHYLLDRVNELNKRLPAQICTVENEPTELDIICKQMELLEMQWLRANAQKVQLQRSNTTLETQ